MLYRVISWAPSRTVQASMGSAVSPKKKSIFDLLRHTQLTWTQFHIFFRLHQTIQNNHRCTIKSRPKVLSSRKRSSRVAHTPERWDRIDLFGILILWWPLYWALCCCYRDIFNQYRLWQRGRLGSVRQVTLYPKRKVVLTRITMSWTNNPKCTCFQVFWYSLGHM